MITRWAAMSYSGSWVLLSFNVVRKNLGDDAGADSLATFTNREAQTFLAGDRRNELDLQAHVVARHHHLGAFGQRHQPRHVRRPEIKLRPVALEERRVATTFLFLQDVDLAHEVLVRRDAPRLGQHLPALDLLALGPTEQRPDVVARATLVQQLPEHLHAGHHRLHGVLEPDDLDLLADLHDSALHPARDHRAAATDRKYVLNRHQERLVDLPLRLLDERVAGVQQLQHRRLAQLALIAFQRLQRAAADDRRVVARVLVLRKKLTQLHIDQVQQLRVLLGNHVDLVQVHNDGGDADLAPQQDVLACLRHRAVRGRHHQDRAVHLRRARDHILDVVRVPGAVDVGIVPILRLVLHVRDRDRDAALSLFGRLVDLVVRQELREALLRQHLGDRRRQRRLAVVDVTDRPDVQVGLVPDEFFFRHRSRPLLRLRVVRRSIRSRASAPARNARTAWCTSPVLVSWNGRQWNSQTYWPGVLRH